MENFYFREDFVEESKVNVSESKKSEVDVSESSILVTKSADIPKKLYVEFRETYF